VKYKKGGAATFLGNLMTEAFDAVKNIPAAIFDKIREFEKANADLASILRTTRSQITDLTEEAKRLSRSFACFARFCTCANMSAGINTACLSSIHFTI
jgi:hypothetical protein